MGSSGKPPDTPAPCEDRSQLATQLEERGLTRGGEAGRLRLPPCASVSARSCSNTCPPLVPKGGAWPVAFGSSSRASRLRGGCSTPLR